MAVATATLLLTAATAGFAAYQQNQAGKAADAMSQRNADATEMAAETMSEEARENSRRERANNRSTLSSMKARLAAQGADITQGTVPEIMGEAAGRLELNVLDRSRQAQSQIASVYDQAEMTRWEGKVAKNNAKMQAFGTLLQGVGQVGQMAYRSKQSGSLLTPS